VIGPLLGYEVITAFFLEAAFLGVLLFGRKLVPQWAHVLSATGGARHAAVVVLDPRVEQWCRRRRHEVVDGRFVPVDLVQLIFNPVVSVSAGAPVTAFVVTTALVILGFGAHFLLHRGTSTVADHGADVVVFLTVMVPFQIIVGDCTE